MKRSCFSKLPKRIRRMSASPKRGLPIGIFLLVQTIVLPLILVGVDIVTDGDVLRQMWPHTGSAAKGLNSAAGGGNNSSSDEVEVNEERNKTVNDTGDITNSTGTELEDQSEGAEGKILLSLFGVSIVILSFSTLIMILSNPLASLVRRATTTSIMSSRELERKDVPVPLGNN